MTDIAALRAEIDAIDDKIIALFNARSEIVKNVGKLKQKTQKSGVAFIRSGREADLIRSIYARFKEGVFPACAATHIWRMVISASLTLESALTVSVCDEEADKRIYWLAREYFGNFLPISHMYKADNIIAAVASGKTQVGVLPMTGPKWWADLPDDIKIFACLPFVLQGDEDKVEALAIAKLEPEPSQEDIGLLKLVADKALSAGEVGALFGKHRVQAHLLDRQHNAHLVGVPGFLSETSEIVVALRQETGCAVSVLGNYAVPLKI